MSTSRLSRVAVLAVVAFTVLALAWGGVLSYEASRSGLTGAEMDFDHDGRTSVGEFLMAADVEQRVMVSHGQRCIEWFSLKDGLPVAVRCPSL